MLCEKLRLLVLEGERQKVIVHPTQRRNGPETRMSSISHNG